MNIVYMQYHTNNKSTVNYYETIIDLVNDYLNGTYRVIPLKTIIYLLSFVLLYLKPKKKVTIMTKIKRIGALLMVVKSFKGDLDRYIYWKNKKNVMSNTMERQDIPVEVTV